MSRLLAALVSTGACLLLLECGVRALWSPPRAPRIASLVQASPHPEIGYELRPGVRARVWDTDVRVNLLGFRGPEVEPPRADRYRVAVVGDSVAFGISVSEDAAFPARLEQLLNQGEGRFEVLNLAVVGYDVVQAVASAAHRAARLEPDLVVLSFCLNDVGVVSGEGRHVALQRFANGWPGRYSRLALFVHTRFLRARLARRLRLANRPRVFAATHARHIEPIGADETPLRELMAATASDHPSDWYRSEARIGRLRFAFRWLARLSSEEGFEVLVAIVPWLDDSRGRNHEGAHRIVAHEARRAGLVPVDLLDALPRDVPPASLRLTPQDPAHPSPAGHLALARALVPHVRARAAGGG